MSTTTATGCMYVGTDDLGALVATSAIATLGMDAAILQAAQNLFTGFDATYVDVQVAHDSTLSTIGYARRSEETGEWALSMLAVTDYSLNVDPDDTYSGGTVTVTLDNDECTCGDDHDVDYGDEYAANDAYVDSFDEYYERTYSPVSAWLDDTRLPYDPPHASHDTSAISVAEWRADVASGQTMDSFEVYAQAWAAYHCNDCNDYASDYSARMAERRAGC